MTEPGTPAPPRPDLWQPLTAAVGAFTTAVLILTEEHLQGLASAAAFLAAWMIGTRPTGENRPPRPGDSGQTTK